MKKFLSTICLSLVLCSLFLVTGCGGGGGSKATYKSLNQGEAVKMITDNPDVIVLDVRTADEFEKKHIPNAISVPLEELRNGNFSSIPDKNQTILIYCWTGRRAQDSAQLLVDKGYKNVYEFGGLVDWTGPVAGTGIYKHITQEEAREILETNPDATLIDCRFPKDYEAKHIVGAVFVPKEAVMAEDFSKIPDKDAPIIAYCGDGNRARQTAELLVNKGYTNVYEMGGIIDWTGPVEGTEVNN